MLKVGRNPITKTNTWSFSGLRRLCTSTSLAPQGIYITQHYHDHDAMKGQSSANAEISEIVVKAHNIGKAVQAIIENIACPIRRR